MTDFDAVLRSQAAAEAASSADVEAEAAATAARSSADWLPLLAALMRAMQGGRPSGGHMM